MQTHFNFIEIDMDQLFTICTDLGDLSVKIDRIAAAGATCNNNADDLGFLLHFKYSFPKCLFSLTFATGMEMRVQYKQKFQKNNPLTELIFLIVKLGRIEDIKTPE
jgi:hypothetical protein